MAENLASLSVQNDRAGKRKKGTGRVFARPGSKYFWCQYYMDGRQVRVSTGHANLEKAEKFLRRQIGKVENEIHEDVGRVTYESMRERLFLNYQTKKRRSLRRDKEGNLYLDKVKRLDEYFTGWTAKQITSDALARYVVDQQKRGRADGTINRSLSALRRMFHLAKLRTIPDFGDVMLKEADAREGFFERDEYERLSRALPAELRLPLALGYFTGMRLGEVLMLRWNRIPGDGKIHLRGSDCKNGNPREIPIIAELRDILAKYRVDGQEFVCVKLNRQGDTVRIQSFRKAWYSACVKAGLGHFEPKTNADGKPIFAKPRRVGSKPKVEMKYVGKIFHDLRRSAVRNMVEAGIAENIAMKISGHETREVFDRYNIVSPKNIDDASRKLDAYQQRMAREISGDSSGDSEAKNVTDKIVIQ